MPANSSVITVTANGVTKYYLRLPNGLIEPFVRPSDRKKNAGEW
jgi:hypothetical protein